MPGKIARIALLSAALLAAACSRKAPTGASPASTSSAAEPSAAAESGPPRPVALDAIRHLDDCSLGHRGVLLDLGDRSMRSHFITRRDTPEPESVGHEGATWSRVTQREVVAEFYWSGDIERRTMPPSALPADGGAPVDSGAYVEVRLRGVGAKWVAAYLNGKPVGSRSISRGETQVVLLRGGSGPILPGANEVSLHFGGGSKNDDDVLAEVDWIHVGSGDIPEPYAAPSRAESITNATVASVSKKALSLRAPGYVRCTGWIPQGASVEAAIAVSGAGEADAEVRLLKDRGQPVVLGTVHASGGPGAKWMNVSMPVGDVGGGTLGAFEIAPVRTTAKGARVLVADARLVGPIALPPSAVRLPSRGVVVVVLGSVAPRSLGPYGGPRAVPNITELAQAGVVFDGHRASTSLASGAFASMLTGLPSRAHTVEDPDARLPRPLTTIADAARQAGVSTALFTANPTTGMTFGFDRGWDTYVAHGPTEEVLATQVFDEAAKWIDGHKDARFLVVIHARGGHPPWDVTPEDMKSLAPVEYAGQLDPHRAAETLAKAKRGPTRFTEQDRARVWALYAHAVEDHDAAIGRLVTTLRLTGRDADTTVILTGDSSASEAAQIPFVDSDSLEEPSLGLPLIVRPPRVMQLGGHHVSLPTSSVDMGRTVLAALGLPPPATFQGLDVMTLATGETLLSGRPLMATTAARFAARWGSFVFSGARERERSRLCDLLLEPTCNIDVRKTYPLAMEALHRFTFEALGPASSTGARVSREPAFLDPATLTSLLAWGRPAEKKKKRDLE